MKIFFLEYPINYEKYLFPYQVWLLKEEGDSPDEIYNSGFLPIRSLNNVYYLSRSVRVDLKKFDLSSENRRILKKTDFVDFQILPISEFNYSYKVQKLCRLYSKERMNNSLSSYAIKSLFIGKIFNYVMVAKDKANSKEIGYCVCFVSDNLIHYAHSFYDLNYLSSNIGARMMLQAVNWAKENHKKYIYLGTCYEANFLYKTEFKGVEFFDGFRWSSDLQELKELISQKRLSLQYDYIIRNKKFINDFFKGSIFEILNNFGIRIKFFNQKDCPNEKQN